jgi:hypothetical protein
MRSDITGASPYKLKKMPQEISILQQPQDRPNPMMYLMAYELGQDGWPTGTIVALGGEGNVDCERL